jgi:TRAP-type C4-dicarboxylate transport system permease small subunit
MSEAENRTTRPTDSVGRVLYDITRVLAILGGIAFCSVALIMTISITGRTFFATPVRGYFELVGLGTGVAVFALLPYCQMKRENIVVDFFLSSAAPRVRAICDAVGCLLYGVIIVVMTWRTAVGGFDIRDAGQRTTMLDIPLWAMFPWSVACLTLLCLACFYTFVRSAKEARSDAAP